MSDRWHVVVDPMCKYPSPEKAIWTLSCDPNIPGWNTDGGYEGYGLAKDIADFLAESANARVLDTSAAKSENV